MVSGPNSHIRVRGSMFLLNGNPGAYLNGLRDAKNRTATHASDRIEYRRKKVDFGEFVTNMGGRSPRTIALIRNATVVAPASASGAAVENYLKELPAGSYFCKPNVGRNGIGAFRLTIGDDGPRVDDEARSVSDVTKIFSSEDYVIQEWVAPLQHPDIARFRDGVINTMRLVTFETNAGPKALAASLRMAISLKSIDSWTQGGVVAGIDLKRGVLKPFGCLKKGLKIVDRHPGSGLPFRDQPIPHVREAVAMACKLHARLGGAKSIGWDIALLKDGPCFLESNKMWDVIMSAQLNPGFVPAFIAVHLPKTCDRAVRLEFDGPFESRVQICRAVGSVLGKALASGRIERLGRERLSLTVGGTQDSVQAALRMFRLKARDRMKIAPSRNRPDPGFDVTSAFADA